MLIQLSLEDAQIRLPHATRLEAALEHNISHSFLMIRD